MAGYAVTYSVVDNATKNIDAINKRMAALRAPMERMSKSVSRFVDVSGLRKVAQGFDWIWKSAANVLRTLTQIVPAMAGITGAATIAGLFKLVDGFAAWSHTLVQNADQIGITTQELEKLQNATRLAGGNADDMTESLRGFKQTLFNLSTGSGNVAEIQQQLNKWGISLKNADGSVKQFSEQGLRDLIKQLGAIKDPTDRARAANELLGASGNKLVESFRQSTMGIDAAIDAANKYGTLTADQIRDNQKYTEAQGRLGVAFGTLGEQISAMVSRDFTPLLTQFAAFVEQNTPMILAAVDDISKRFAAWLADPETGKMFIAAIKSVADSLVWVSHNLDTVKDVAEGVAAMFAIKWAVGIVRAVGTVTEAFGVVGVGGAAGLGILGALGLVLWLTVEVIRHWDDLKQAGIDLADGVGKAFDRVGKSLSDFWKGVHDPNDLPKPGEVPSYPTPAPFTPGGAWAPPPPGTPTTTPGGAWAPPATPPAPPGGAWAPPSGGPRNLSLPENTTARGGAITANLARDLDLPTASAAGITGNLQAESGLKAINEKNPTVAGSRGGFGWAQWTGPRRREFEAYAKENNLDPKSDEANYGFLVHELHGKKFAGMLKQLRELKGPNAARDAAALVERVYENPAVSNAGVRGGYADKFAAAAPSVAVAQQAPVKGSVDVNITHRNPPPNSAVTATGSGSVNVAPVRVEQQNMADI